MAEISLRTARRHLNIEVARRHLVGGADQATDRSDQAIGESEPDPDRGKQHREREEHKHRGEPELEAVPMRLEASPHVGDERRVFRDLGGQRVDPARRIQELPVGAVNRPNADEDIPGAEKPAQSLPVHRVLEVGGLGPGDQLSSDPWATTIGVPSFFMSAAAVKPSVFARELK